MKESVYTFCLPAKDLFVIRAASLRLLAVLIHISADLAESHVIGILSKHRPCAP